MSHHHLKGVFRLKFPDVYNHIIQDENGKLNPKTVLNNLIYDLTVCINKLKCLNDSIPEDNLLDICGSGNCLGFQGDQPLIKKLIENQIINEWTEDDDEDLIYYNFSLSSSSESGEGFERINSDDNEADNCDSEDSIS